MRISSKNTPDLFSLFEDKMTKDPDNFGKFLKKFCTTAGISEAEVASACMKTRQDIHKVMNDAIKLTERDIVEMAASLIRDAKTGERALAALEHYQSHRPQI